MCVCIRVQEAGLVREELRRVQALLQKHEEGVGHGAGQDTEKIIT